MVAMSGGAGQFVFDLVARLGISCDVRQTGWIQPDHNDNSDAVVRRLVEQWARRGAPLRMLDRETTATLLGTGIYRGATMDERGGNLPPLNYALGLAAAAIRAGATLHGGCRGVVHEARGSGHWLRTFGGESWRGRCWFAPTAMPRMWCRPWTGPWFRSARCRSRPKSCRPRSLHPSCRRGIRRQTRAGCCFISARTRRGAASWVAAATTDRCRCCATHRSKPYPELRDISWQYAWGGFVAMTPDHHPHLSLVAPGVMATQHRLSRNNAPVARRPTPAVSQTACRPHVARAAPKISGAAACRIRAGALSHPRRAP